MEINLNCKKSEYCADDYGPDDNSKSCADGIYTKNWILKKEG